MIEIDKLYDKTDKEITKLYEVKHENLIKEENELKDKLKNEVTKIKENLDIDLSKINEIIRKAERIIKGLKILLEDKDVKMIKKLNYISNINKNLKQMRFMNQKLMKNLKIIFNENKNNIIFDEYYFNGLQMPKDIQFSEINTNSFKISWKKDEIKIKNKDVNDYNEMKYKVEIRKNNNKFKLVYEGNNNKCEINDLEEDTNYEIRICSFYNNINSNWTEIYKIKTKDIDSTDSNILNKTDRKKEYINKIFEWTRCSSMKLLYRGTRDGMSGKDFHNKCDNKGKTICLFLNDKDNIFGGYSSIPWTKDGGDKIANDCFLFTLSNIYNTKPTKFPYVKERSVCHSETKSPIFGRGSDLYFGEYQDGDYTHKNNNGSSFPCSYQDTLGKGRTIFNGDYNIKNQYIKLKEIEVYEVN